MSGQDSGSGWLKSITSAWSGSSRPESAEASGAAEPSKGASKFEDTPPKTADPVSELAKIIRTLNYCIPNRLRHKGGPVKLKYRRVSLLDVFEVHGLLARKDLCSFRVQFKGFGLIQFQTFFLNK